MWPFKSRKKGEDERAEVSEVLGLPDGKRKAVCVSAGTCPRCENELTAVYMESPACINCYYVRWKKDG